MFVWCVCITPSFFHLMVRTSGTTKKSNTRGDQELNGSSVVTNDGADLSRPMVLHGAALQPSHERSESNDNCSEDLTPAKAMKLSTEEVKAYDDFAAIGKRVLMIDKRHK
jgi:hypothetical protein